MRKHYSVHIFERINLFRCCLLFKESSRIFLCWALRNICSTIWFELGAFPLSLFLAICQFLSGGFYCLEAICMCIFGSYILVGYLFSLAKNGKTHLLKLDPSKYRNSAHWTAYAILVMIGQFLWTQIEVKNSYSCFVMTDKLAETCCWRQSGCFSLRNNGLSSALSFWKLKVYQREKASLSVSACYLS